MLPPEEERQARGDLHGAQAVRLPGRRAGRIAFDAQEEIRIDQHPFERELDAGLEAAAALPAALEEGEQRLDVVLRHRPAIGAPRQARHDLGGAGPLVRDRCGIRPAGEDRAAARRVAGTRDLVWPADADRADRGVPVIDLVVRQELARLPRLQDPFRLPDVADERHPDRARSRLHRHADLQPIVGRLQIGLPLRVAPLGDGERDRRGPAAGLAADREPPHQLAVDPHVELVGRGHAEDVVLPVGPQLDLDEVVAVDREVIWDGHAAPRAEREILALALVLQQEQRHVEGLEPRSGGRQPGGEPRDGASRREVALELRGGNRQHVGVVVEAGVRGLVARQQRRDVQVEREQVANRVPILGPVQPVDGAGPARIRVRRRDPVDVPFEPVRHGVIGLKVRTRASRRRHRAGPQLGYHPLPDVGVAARVRGVDRGRVQGEPAGPQPVVVTRDAVPVQDRARREICGRLRGSGSLYGLRRRPGLGSERAGRGLDPCPGQEEGANGRHEPHGSRQPGRTQSTAALRSHHPMLLRFAGVGHRDARPAIGIVPRGERPGNT